MSDTQLIPLENINGSEVFSGEALDDLLSKIRTVATSDDYDVSSPEGRKEIASRAYSVSRSKTTIDDAGKTLVSEWKSKAKVVDASRKKARDYLDALRDEVRAPLTEWEAEEKRKEQEIIDAARRAEEEAEAARIAEIEAKEAELRKRELAIKEAEEAAARKLYEEKRAAEQKEREEAIAKAAAERAEKEKLEAIEREKAAKAKAEKDAIDAAKRAEEDKARAIAEAEARATEKAERERRDRESKEAAIRAERERLERDKEHRRLVNGAAVSSLTENGFSEDDARKIITLIASDSIANVIMDYSRQIAAA